MKRLAYILTFLTPAFLGAAEQSGRWRTPPVKALLRQWWRVVWAFPMALSRLRTSPDRYMDQRGLVWRTDA
jgi:hypothetical protein